MVMGFSGWMDGGDVSVGTVDGLIRALGARPAARIEPEGFYIYNFPGSMEISALFRPHTRIEDGLVAELDFPDNTFFADAGHNLVLFHGKEPNVRWRDYADCVFEAAATFDVRRIYFVGSVAGVVPHTREPRLSCSVSEERLKEELEPYVVRFSNYEGPASLVTYLTREAPARGVEMAALVAEIPAYVRGTNPTCIESVTRRLAGILGVQVDLEHLQRVRRVFEEKLSEAVEEREDLAELIHKLEGDYDNEVFDTQMGDLKDWLEQKGIRLD